MLRLQGTGERMAAAPPIVGNMEALLEGVEAVDQRIPIERHGVAVVLIKILAWSSMPFLVMHASATLSKLDLTPPCIAPLSICREPIVGTPVAVSEMTNINWSCRLVIEAYLFLVFPLANSLTMALVEFAPLFPQVYRAVYMTHAPYECNIYIVEKIYLWFLFPLAICDVWQQLITFSAHDYYNSYWGREEDRLPEWYMNARPMHKLASTLAYALVTFLFALNLNSYSFIHFANVRRNRRQLHRWIGDRRR